MLQANYNELSVENILRLVSQKKIFEELAGVQLVKGKFCSPFREDKSPSCSFRQTASTGRIYIKDGSTGEMHDCFRALMKKKNLSFRESLRYINEKLRLGLDSYEVINYNDDLIESYDEINQNVKYDFVEGNGTQKDYAYGHKYGITKNVLQLYGVTKARIVYKDGKYSWKSTEANPVFVYTDFPDDGLKLYRPSAPSKKNKGRSSCSIKDISGYNQLPNTGKLLFITSSLKDVMTLHVLGFAAVALQNEQVYLEKETFKQLSERFDEIVVFFDNDEAGFSGALEYNKLYKLDSIVIPDEYECKDPSDLVAKIGIEDSKKLIKKLLQHKKAANKLMQEIPFFN